MVAGAPLRIVFFGTPDFAVPTLEELLRSRHRIAAVVTQPDRPRGRGHRRIDSPVKTIAIETGVPVLQPDRLKDAAFLRAFADLSADVAVVAAYGRILPAEVLAIPRRGFLNVHASLLPRYRGAAPVHRAIIAGEHETGVTIMRVVPALDAGPVLATVRLAIGPSDTSDQVEQRLAEAGAGLLLATIEALEERLATETPQDEAAATYAPRLDKGEGRIDWSWSAARIHNVVRGLHPWPLSFSFIKGHRVILRRSAIAGERSRAQPGTVVEAAGDRLVVGTGEGEVAILEIQPEGKRAMTARDFLAGHRVTVGDQFSSLS
jgi:methionyl-tRNA formyltransferase